MKFTYKATNGSVTHVIDVGHKIKKLFFPAWVAAEAQIVSLSAQIVALKDSKDVYIINNKDFKNKNITFPAKGSFYLEANNSSFTKTIFMFHNAKLNKNSGLISLFGNGCSIIDSSFISRSK